MNFSIDDSCTLLYAVVSSVLSILLLNLILSFSCYAARLHPLVRIPRRRLGAALPFGSMGKFLCENHLESPIDLCSTHSQPPMSGVPSPACSVCVMRFRPRIIQLAAGDAITIPAYLASPMPILSYPSHALPCLALPYPPAPTSPRRRTKQPIRTHASRNFRFQPLMPQQLTSRPPLPRIRRHHLLQKVAEHADLFIWQLVWL